MEIELACMRFALTGGLRSGLLIDPIDKYVGTRIRARRKQTGLSQASLAKALAVSAQQLHKYETGANRVSPSRMHALGKLLDVEPSYFFEMTDAAEDLLANGNSAEAVDMTDVEHLAMAMIKIRSRSLRRDIIRLIEGIADEQGK